MALEQPVALSAINRLSEATVQVAAYNAAFALAIFIESPVIDLLTTSNALGWHRQAYAKLSQFTWWIIGGVTAVHALVTFTPLWGIITMDLMGLTPRISEAAWGAMVAMLPWSGLIGWRRYLHGMMVRHGITRPIGFGTFLRIIAVVAVAAGLLAHGGVEGATVGGIALVAGVLVEAVYIQIVSRKLIREKYSSDLRDGLDSRSSGDLTMGKLLRFHMPLTLSTAMVMLVPTMVVGSLARAENSLMVLAAWPAAMSIAMLFRGMMFSASEVVVALQKDDQTARDLFRFCLWSGFVLSLVVASIALSGLGEWVYTHVLGLDPELIPLANTGLLLLAVLPFIQGWTAYARGMLTVAHLTVVRIWAVMVSLGFAVVALNIGLQLGWPGVVVGWFGLTMSLVGEGLVLAWAWRSVRSRPTPAAV